MQKISTTPSTTSPTSARSTRAATRPPSCCGHTPECTNRSQAEGQRRAAASEPDLFGETLPSEAVERSRATTWEVPRFAEAMLTRGHAARRSSSRTSSPPAKWIMWPAWLQAIDCLGYAHQVVCLDSRHAPAVSAPRARQSRDTLYVVYLEHA
jgi:DNA (cytosine-5)-methyltransferase 1